MRQTNAVSRVLSRAHERGMGVCLFMHARSDACGRDEEPK